MRSSPSRRRIYGLLFVSAVTLFLLLNSTILWVNEEAQTSGSSQNVLNEDSLIVYRAYHDRRIPSKSLVRILGFGRCLSSDFRITIDSNSAEITPIEGQCPWKWAPNCDWNSFLVTAEIQNPKNHVILEHANRSLLVPVISMPPSLHPGFSVCVPPLYWFSNWPAIVQFIEIWRIQGASHFFVYVHSLSVTAREVLRFYEQQGILTVIPWNELPSRSGVNPNLSLYRLGHSLAHNDCVFRSNSRFTALVDIDEFVIPLKNRSLADYLNDAFTRHPLAGSFLFSHAKIRFADQNWSEVDFSWLQRAFVEEGNGPPKVVFLPDRTEILLTHQVRSHFSPFAVIEVPSTEALLFHARSNWAQNNAPGEFSPIRIFSDDVVQAVSNAYKAVQGHLRVSSVENLVLNAKVSILVQNCLKDWKESGCKTPFYECYSALHNAEKWVYNLNWNDYAVL